MKLHHILITSLPLLCFCLAVTQGLSRAEDGTPAYVGSVSCQSCHDEIYERFSKLSKKAHTRNNVEKMLHKLSVEEQRTCYQCHTTGYGQKGGFVSYSQTPELGDVGCETCHGPGSLHAETGDTELIQRRPSIEQCNTCHNAERIRNFNFKPTIFSGAH